MSESDQNVDLRENCITFVVQAGDITPIEATFASPSDPLAELGDPLTRVQSVRSAKTDSTSTLVALDDSFPDGGIRAWTVVLGCFLYTCTFSGWGLVWGVLQEHYHTEMFPNAHLNVLALVIGLSNLSANASSYLFGELGDRFGYKKIIAISCCLTHLCLLASAFATELYQIFLFQGFLLGFSQGISIPLYFSLSSQWFLTKRGLATGLVASGAGFGGSIEALIMHVLITKIGYKLTMIAFSSAHAMIWISAWFMIAERKHTTNSKISTRKSEKITASLCSVALSVFMGVFGYSTPYYMIESFTRTKFPGLRNSVLITVPLIVMNCCLGVGRLVAVRLADGIGPTNMFFISLFVGGILQMLFWTFARSYASVIAFSVINGLIGSWFICLIPIMCAKLFGVEGLSTVTRFMILASSPGQFIGSAVTATILSSSQSNWSLVSLYSGSMQIVGSLTIILARFHKSSHPLAKI